MAAVKLIDYYGILNLPPTADLVGIENAYARLSSELAQRSEVDETSVEALRRVNEAYAVLSRPTLRHEYDTMFFRNVLERQKEELEAARRRRHLVGNLLVAALGVVVLAQLAGLVYLAAG